ncbi:hypothetical protein LEP3755_57370 [Leptolyngbya sp. NIES-3755]|nr:hypothetical protein LEP3755_57370 [Leptolyngbya sp. NIES-3755]
MRKQIGFGILAMFLTLVGWVAPVFAQTKPALNPPLESQLQPKAQITLNGDRVNVTLINLTNADVAYQAIGDTQVRTLPGRGTVNLQGLRVPTTLTFDRQDSGLLNITPKQSATAPNTIEVTLDATTDLGVDSPTMRVESNGSVFLY